MSESNLDRLEGRDFWEAFFALAEPDDWDLELAKEASDLWMTCACCALKQHGRHPGNEPQQDVCPNLPARQPPGLPLNPDLIRLGFDFYDAIHGEYDRPKARALYDRIQVLVDAENAAL